jgi:hypothetical protein
MNTELSEYLRLSPYQLTHISKYEPTALISESDLKSSTEVHDNNKKLSTFRNYDSNQ